MKMCIGNDSIDKIYTSGAQYLEDIIIAINKAEKSILIESYIFEIGYASKLLFEALRSVLKKDVQVYLMVDGFGSYFYIEKLEVLCREYGIHFKVYHPIHLHIWRKFFLWNKRNHRKTIVIDSQIAFLGSINIADVHFNSTEAIPWQDLAVQVCGEGVLDLEKAFFRSWSRKLVSLKHSLSLEVLDLPFKIKEKWRQKSIRLNTHWILRVFYWLDLMKRIRTAQTQIVIINAYFFPHRSLLRNLKKAAQKGVSITLILPQKTDVEIVKWAKPFLYKIFLDQKILIFEFTQSILHTKAILIDDWGVIGSHNLNHRSLIHDLECEAVIRTPEHIQELSHFFENCKNNSNKISSSDLQNWTFLDKLKCRIVLLFKYLI